MKIKEVLKYLLLIALIATLLSSTYLVIYTNNEFQACLKKNRSGSGYMAIYFHLSVGRATDIGYLLREYREGFIETEPNEDNMEALVGGFFHEMEYAQWFLNGLRSLNPELSEYEKPLYFIDRFMQFTIIQWESFTGGPTVRSVLENLLDQAQKFGNYSIPVTAFEELDHNSFQKIDELASEVAESFAPFNATRLDNTVIMVEELQSILSQWIDEYS